jgi:hypothetical protein
MTLQNLIQVTKKQLPPKWWQLRNLFAFDYLSSGCQANTF